MNMLTTEEAAAELTRRGRQCSAEQVRQWAKSGLFNGAIKTGTRWSIPSSALDAFMVPSAPVRNRKSPWRFLASIVGALATVATILQGIGTFKDVPRQLNDWFCHGPTFLFCVFPPEKPEETLIIIAKFQQTTRVNNIHNKIRAAILDISQGKTPIRNLRVEVFPDTLDASNEEEAKKIGRNFNASLVIWGEDLDTNITVKTYNLKYETLVLPATPISELARVQASYPQKPYQVFVTTDLPAQMGFFAYLSVAQTLALDNRLRDSFVATQTAIQSISKTKDLESVSIRQGLQRAFFLLGWLHHQVKGLNLAIEKYTSAIRIDPTFSTGYFYRGLAQFQKKDHKLAILDFTRVIELDPKNSMARYFRASSYFEERRFDLAIKDQSVVIQLKPDFAEAYLGRGDAYQFLGEKSLAIQDFKTAEKISQTQETKKLALEALEQLGE